MGIKMSDAETARRSAESRGRRPARPEGRPPAAPRFAEDGGGRQATLVRPRGRREQLPDPPAVPSKAVAPTRVGPPRGGGAPGRTGGSGRGGAPRGANGLRRGGTATAPPAQAAHAPQAGPSTRTAPSVAPAAAPASVVPGVGKQSRRMPFIVLLCGLLAGALASLLVISTTLAAGSFRITTLQQQVNALARQRQQLQEQVAADKSAQIIGERAYQLGMRPPGELEFLNLKNGKVSTDAGSGATSRINVPGFTP